MSEEVINLQDFVKRETADTLKSADEGFSHLVQLVKDHQQEFLQDFAGLRMNFDQFDEGVGKLTENLKAEAVKIVKRLKDEDAKLFEETTKFSDELKASAEVFVDAGKTAGMIADEIIGRKLLDEIVDKIFSVELKDKILPEIRAELKTTSRCAEISKKYIYSK